MVGAVFDSLFEQVRERLQVGRRIMQDKGGHVISSIAVIQDAGPARVAGIAQ